jgi:hypothetical protein
LLIHAAVFVYGQQNVGWFASVGDHHWSGVGATLGSADVAIELACTHGDHLGTPV